MTNDGCTVLRDGSGYFNANLNASSTWLRCSYTAQNLYFQPTDISTQNIVKTHRSFERVPGDLCGLPPSGDDRLRVDPGLDEFLGLAEKLGRENDDRRRSVANFVVLEKNEESGLKN